MRASNHFVWRFCDALSVGVVRGHQLICIMQERWRIHVMKVRPHSSNRFPHFLALIAYEYRILEHVVQRYILSKAEWYNIAIAYDTTIIQLPTSLAECFAHTYHFFGCFDVSLDQFSIFHRSRLSTQAIQYQHGNLWSERCFGFLHNG